jgi:hypothetical protein
MFLSFNMNYHKLDTNFIKNFSVFLRVPWHFFLLRCTPRMCFYFFFLSVAVFYFLLSYYLTSTILRSLVHRDLPLFPKGSKESRCIRL